MKKDFKTDTWEMFNREIKNKNIVIFGASWNAKAIIQNVKKFNSDWDIKYVTDNDEEKWGKEFEGYCIVAPEKILGLDQNTYVILICSMHVGEISEQLDSWGIDNYFSEFWMEQAIKVSYQQIVPKEKIKWLKEVLCDNVSKKILDSIVEKRKDNFMDYTDIKYWGKSEYFIEDFWKPLQGGREVFVDGGGFTGDSIEEFIEWTQGDYAKIYCFEPDPKKAQIIQKNLWRWNGKVDFYERGLYNEATTLKFSEGNDLYSGKINLDEAEKTIEIETISLDSVVKEKVTFIKMDIEGAEIPALKGAMKTIVRDKPRLAICIYHKMDDLWEIPELIKKMVPEYKLFMRHCGVRCRGTIIYASI